MESSEFFSDPILPVDSASNINYYQEISSGVKVAGAYGWQHYHLHVPTV
jgi:hypothetical protein